MSALPPKAAPAAKAKPKAADGEKKERAPRQDYGFAKDAKITLTDGEKTYRGKVPLTLLRLTRAGHAAFDKYRKGLKTAIS